MKVLNLQCHHGHGFEGWFASIDDFLAQNGAQRIACPLCGDAVIKRLPSAPRLNLGTKVEASVSGGPGKANDSGESTADHAQTALVPHHPPMPADMPPEVAATLQARWMQAVRHVLANTDDVGPKFAEEARRIHYGEVQARGIRGQATREEREALLDEGIEVASIPMPDALKGPLQ
jgi:hypothetical protein